MMERERYIKFRECLDILAFEKKNPAYFDGETEMMSDGKIEMVQLRPLITEIEKNTMRELIKLGSGDLKRGASAFLTFNNKVATFKNNTDRGIEAYLEGIR